jgi:hypothetical protein
MQKFAGVNMMKGTQRTVIADKKHWDMKSLGAQLTELAAEEEAS